MFRKNKKRRYLIVARKKSERELLELYLKEKLDDKNIYNFKGNPRGLTGFPDRIVFADIVYFIELKLGKENKSYYGQTPMQKKWGQQIEQTPNVYCLLSTRNKIDEVVEMIYERCKSKGILNYFAYNKKIE